MKILYISPLEKKSDLSRDPQGENLFDLDSTSSIVIEGINSRFDDIEIATLRDLLVGEAHVPEDVLNKFDLYLCNLTTSNPNITYFSGLVEGMGKPIIYFVSNTSSIPLSLTYKRVLSYSEASLENEFREELNRLILAVKKNPNKFSLNSQKITEKPKAFISYSHKDKIYLQRLMVHLRPLERKGLIDIWVDSKLKAGDQWKEEIEKALKTASIAILLISADFMASEFIIDNELPPLLSQVEVKGTKIIPVILSPCRFEREPNLNRFQSINLPSEPLSAMNDDKKEFVYDQLASEIEDSLKKS